MTNILKYLMLLASFGLMASDNKEEKREDGKYAPLKSNQAEEPKKVKRTVLDPYLLRDLQKIVAGYLDIYDYNVQKINNLNIDRNSLVTFYLNRLHFVNCSNGEELFKQVFKLMAPYINGYLINEKFDIEKSKNNNTLLDYNKLIEAYNYSLSSKNLEQIKHIEDIYKEIFSINFDLLNSLDEIKQKDKKIKSIIRILEYSFVMVRKAQMSHNDMFTLKRSVKNINSIFHSILIDSENFYDFRKCINSITISQDGCYLAINYQSIDASFADEFLDELEQLKKYCVKFDYDNQFCMSDSEHLNKSDYNRVLNDVCKEVEACLKKKSPHISTIEVWDLKSKKMIYQKNYNITKEDGYRDSTLVISPNNRYLAYKVADANCLSLLNLNTQKQKALFYIDKETKKINPIYEPTLLKFSENSSYIFADTKSKLFGWNIETGDLLFHKTFHAGLFSSEPFSYETGFDFSQDGQYMIYWGENNETLEEFYKNLVMTNKCPLLYKDILQFSSLVLAQNQGVVLMEELEEENTKK